MHKCHVCEKSYRQAASLRCHMLSHSGEVSQWMKPRWDPFYRLITLPLQKPFVCNICGKGMTQKSGFKKHMLIHTGEKPHRCDHCGKWKRNGWNIFRNFNFFFFLPGKDFRYSSNLIIHKRSHVGDRKHKCDVCEKKFVGIEQLKRHALIHTGQVRRRQINF